MAVGSPAADREVTDVGFALVTGSDVPEVASFVDEDVECTAVVRCCVSIRAGNCLLVAGRWKEENEPGREEKIGLETVLVDVPTEDGAHGAAACCGGSLVLDAVARDSTTAGAGDTNLRGDRGEPRGEVGDTVSGKTRVMMSRKGILGRMVVDISPVGDASFRGNVLFPPPLAPVSVKVFEWRTITAARLCGMLLVASSPATFGEVAPPATPGGSTGTGPSKTSSPLDVGHSSSSLSMSISIFIKVSTSRPTSSAVSELACEQMLYNETDGTRWRGNANAHRHNTNFR